MKTSSSTPDWDSLLKHSSWVRALACSLVSDPSAAADVEQQAWLKAAEHPPRNTRNLRAWFASVVRSSAGMHWRRQRPTSSFLEELDGVCACDSVVERMDTVRNLAAAVASLPEPYASAIYLRYFEELSVREVAERQGVPVNTAQTRLSRGLDKLRLKLEGSLGADWRNQCLVFAAPLSAAPAVVLGTTTAIAMTAKSKLILAAAIVLAASLGVLQPWDTPNPLPVSPIADALLEAPAPSASADFPADVVVERSEFVSADGAGTSASILAGGSAELIIRVVDGVTLEPVPNVEVLFFDYATDPESRRRKMEFRYLSSESNLEHFGKQLETDENGEVLVTLPANSFSAAARLESKYAEIFRNAYEQDEPRLLELTLLDSVALPVRVLGADNQPVSGVHVGFSGSPIAYSGLAGIELVTDEQGRVVFRHIEKELQQRLAEKGTTLAIGVPSKTPLFFEYQKNEIPNKEVVFHLPETGRVEVVCSDSNGEVIPDGIPVGMQSAPREDRFQQHMAQGYITAYVRDGIAVFANVGVGSKLVVHCSEYYSNQKHTIEAEGPTFAGEVLSLEMIMPAPIPDLPIKLLTKDGNPVPSKFYSVRRGVMNAEGIAQVSGSSTWADKDGRVLLKMSEAKKYEADAMEILVTERFGLAVGTCDFALFHLDLASSYRSVEEPPTFEYGGSTIVAGYCLSPTGRAIPNYELAINFQHKDKSSMELGKSINQLRVSTDAKGYFAFRGSFDQDRFGVRLFCSSDLGAQINGTGYIDFQIGENNLQLIRSGQSNLRGRILVDDPEYLKSLIIQATVGDPQLGFLQQRQAVLEHPNGRFSIENAQLEDTSLEIRDKSTKELLASWVNLPTDHVLENGDVQLPDWDIRNSLHLHSLEVEDIHGVEIENTVISFDADGAWLKPKYENGSGFLSPRAHFDLTVSAPGYRSKNVSLSGYSNVVLEEGIPVHISGPNSVALPTEHTWGLALGKIVDGRFHRSPVVDRQVVSILGEGLHFSADAPGEWAVQLYRSVRREDGGFFGVWLEPYIFESGFRWHPILVKDTNELQSFVLPVTAEGFESMLE